MLKEILAPIVALVTAMIYKYGSWAVVFLMALESANMPIPSEVILTYGGFLVSKGMYNFHLISFAGAAGCVIGSAISYYIGKRLGRPFLWKYGKWFLVSQKDILLADKFIAKYGDWTYFFSRLLPVIRTFISFVVGISEGNFIRFIIYCFFGSWIWSYFLVYIGLKLGDNWQVIQPWWDKFSFFIVFLILLGIVYHVYRVFRDSRQKT